MSGNHGIRDSMNFISIPYSWHHRAETNAQKKVQAVINARQCSWMLLMEPMIGLSYQIEFDHLLWHPLNNTERPRQVRFSWAIPCRQAGKYWSETEIHTRSKRLRRRRHRGLLRPFQIPKLYQWMSECCRASVLFTLHTEDRSSAFQLKWQIRITHTHTHTHTHTLWSSFSEMCF